MEERLLEMCSGLLRPTCRTRRFITARVVGENSRRASESEAACVCGCERALSRADLSTFCGVCDGFLDLLAGCVWIQELIVCEKVPLCVKQSNHSFRSFEIGKPGLRLH